MENYKYCPYCKAELIEKPVYYQCPNCRSTLFKHPALTASVFPVKNSQVLLSIRGIEPKKGMVDAIGGFVQYGEIPEVTTNREAKEELGVEITDLHYLGTYHDSYEYQGKIYKTLNFMYTCKLQDENITPQDDIESVKWFPLDNLPEVAFECVKMGLETLKSRHE